MSTRLSSRGFTLIEVLVALAIVAIALAAAIRAVGLMTDGNGLLRDKSLALLAAESRLAELRLGVGAAPGNSDFECSQGRLRLYCEQRVEATDDPALLWVEIRVRTQREQAVPLARLNTLLSRSRLSQPRLRVASGGGSASRCMGTRRTSPFCSMSTASASIRRTFAARARTSPSR